MPIEISCFKAYDIRGQFPTELNSDIAYRVGNATGQFLNAKTVVLGRDMRLSSGEFADAVARGLTEAGVKVLDIGLCGTEMVYFATAHLGADGGIMVTASHNPADYNGLKLVRDQAKPISGDSGLDDIRLMAESDKRKVASVVGERKAIDVFDAYIEHLLGYVELEKLRPLKILANAGNGCAGVGLDGLIPQLPFNIVKINNEPDGNFPNGIPNPMLLENQSMTANAVLEHGADFGIAWDGDFDRCFLFDELGQFIEGYYIVGLLAESILKANPGGKVVHDPRLTWNTIDIVHNSGGQAIQSKSGHSFIKEKMRSEDALYGGEMSAHHYFKEFSYADSGMIPWLLIAQMMSESSKKLSELVGDRISMFPASGEINRKVSDANATLEVLYKIYAPNAISIDTTDGYSFQFERWRFNVRMSNTEPVIRLNVESRGDKLLLQEMTERVLRDLRE